MSKGTSIKEALTKWEEKNGQKGCDACEVKLCAQLPPIEKMDASLSTLTHCTKLSLSTNCIEKIANLNGLKHLTILSLARNSIKNLTGLEAVSDSLEQLWISYNNVEKLKGIHVLKKLKVLYMANNQVKDWAEFLKLNELPCLVELLMVGNPIQENAGDDWMKDVTGKLKNLRKLDGTPIIKQEEEEEED